MYPVCDEEWLKREGERAIEEDGGREKEREGGREGVWGVRGDGGSVGEMTHVGLPYDILY